MFLGLKEIAMLLPILHLFNDGFLAAMPLVLPFAAEDFGLSLGLVGLLGSLLSFSGIVLALPAGALSARRGSKGILSGAVLCYGLGFLLLGVAGGMISVLLAFLLGSVGFGVFHPVAFSAVAKSSERENRGKIMGLFAATGDIGRITFATAVTFLIGITSWRTTSLIYGGVALLLFLVCFLLSPREKREKSVDGKTSRKKLNLRVLGVRRFALLNTASLIDSFANASLFIFIPFLLAFRGIEDSFIGLFTSIFFVGNLMGKVIMGRLADTMGKERLFISCELFIFLSLIALAFSKSIIAISLLAFFLGFSTKGTVPITSTLIAESVEGEDYEAAYSINSISTSVANTVAPLFFGVLADMLGVQAIFIACGVVALTSTFPVLALKGAKRVSEKG